MLCTGLALFAGPLWYCSLLSCSVSRSGPLCWAMMVPFIHYCHGLYRSGPICWATMVPFIHYCHGLYRSDPVCWATMVLFTIVMVCTGLALSAGPLWYRSLLLWSVSRSDPISWATVVLFTIVMVCTGLTLSAGPLCYHSLLSWSVQVWPCLLGHYVTVHYCHALYRSGPICWTTMVLFVHYCHGLYRSGPGLALSAGLLYHSLLSCSVSMSGPLWYSSLLS